MFYSKSTGGFYDRAIHSDNIPSDAVEISTEEHAALLEGQSHGKMITADKNGFPILVDPPAPTYDVLLAQATSQRLYAYQTEADPLFFKAQRGEATLDEWKAKVEEIKARYPLPVQ